MHGNGMVRVINRADGPFVVKEADYDADIYFEGLENEEPYFYCHAQIIAGVGYLHAYPVRFSRELLRVIRQDFRTVRYSLMLMGVRAVLALMPTTEDIEKWCKFVKLVGFDKPDTIVVDGTPCARVIMEVM